eukprot:6190093-Pleurochrysis_carterae.AAC.1
MLEAHYSSQTGDFSRSFVVGPLNDVCAAAMGYACGLSCATFCNSRADCRMGRPLHKGRCMQRDRLES